MSSSSLPSSLSVLPVIEPSQIESSHIQEYAVEPADTYRTMDKGISVKDIYRRSPTIVHRNTIHFPPPREEDLKSTVKSRIKHSPSVV